MRILIVEDEKRLAGTLAELLHRQGYAVDVSYDGVSGLDNARSGIYDLVLLDAMLPELDGFSLMQQPAWVILSPPLSCISKPTITLVGPAERMVRGFMRGGSLGTVVNRSVSVVSFTCPLSAVMHQ